MSVAQRGMSTDTITLLALAIKNRIPADDTQTPQSAPVAVLHPNRRGSVRAPAKFWAYGPLTGSYPIRRLVGNRLNW
jgi:hypothetical protein